MPITVDIADWFEKDAAVADSEDQPLGSNDVARLLKRLANVK